MSRTHLCVRLLAGLAGLASGGGLLSAAPAWWSARGVTTVQPADDYAAANLGQLKHFTTMAAEELESKLAGDGGMGDELRLVIHGYEGGVHVDQGWVDSTPPSGVVRDDYAMVNQGQLKAVAKMVYDRLNELGYSGGAISPPAQVYPWTASSGDDDDYAAVNLGQLKYVFDFDLGSDPDDIDHDGLSDTWERSHWSGLTARPWDDGDSDGMSNLTEYTQGTNPLVPGWKPGSLGAACEAAVDDRLVGKSVATALAIYSTQNHSTGVYTRNSNVWCADLDLTSFVPYNSGASNLFGGTLVTPRHILMCAHAPYGTGTTVRFVKMDGTVVTRTITHRLTHPSYVPYYPDLTIGLLDSDVPAGVSHAKVLPSNYADYLPAGLLSAVRVPALCLDQEEKALITDLSYLNASEAGFTYPAFASARHAYYEDKVPNDSGNPAFLIINDELVLLTVWTYGGPGRGTNVATHRADINSMITNVDAAAGISTGYSLTTQDLSGFLTYP